MSSAETATAPSPLVFLFVDGLGLGPSDPETNPLLQEDLRVLRVVPLLQREGGLVVPPLFAAVPVDATLGLPGLPQSATGQTSLLTGVNAAALIGRHLNGLPSPRLRELLARESIFLQLARRGLTANFANAFQPEFFHYLPKKRLSATTWAALAGGRPLATLQELAHGRAVYQEFTHLFLRERGYDLPLRPAAEAGRVLASLAGRQPFLLYEYFMTDFAGHGQEPRFARLIVQLLDRFLEAFLETVDLTRLTVVLTSDHGNIEDLSVKTHTRNPVPLLVWGPGAEFFARRVRTLTDLVPAILAYLTGE
jgi:hypothetical protein